MYWVIKRGTLEMKATIFTAVICTAVINLISPASAQSYGQRSYYGPSLHALSLSLARWRLLRPGDG